ncbi:hypothetical protein AgCh_008789 [Apium graveolens]
MTEDTEPPKKLTSKCAIMLQEINTSTLHPIINGLEIYILRKICSNKQLIKRRKAPANEDDSDDGESNDESTESDEDRDMSRSFYDHVPRGGPVIRG